MSKFTVRLNQTGVQGQMDVSMTTGQINATSNQRTVYIMGPDKQNYLLRDGQSFTGNNYWLRYVSTAQGGKALPGQDFLYFAAYTAGAVYDPGAMDYDGGAWSDVTDNMATTSLNVAVVAGTPQTVDFLGKYGGIAKFLQMLADGTGVTYKINGSTVSAGSVSNSATTIFEPGDINWTSITFTNGNGGSGTVNVKITFSIEPDNRIANIV